MAGIAGTNVDVGLIWDPSKQNIIDYYKELGVPGNQYMKHCIGGFRTVKIPTANVLTLNTVPIQIVPAAGSGTLIVPWLMVATLVYVSTTYSTAAGGASLIYGANGDGVSTAMTLTQAFLQASSGTNTQVVQQGSAATYLPTTSSYNAPLTLIAATSDPTTGNSDLYVRVYFHILSGLPFTNPAAVGL